jgi:hypothetical protein
MDPDDLQTDGGHGSGDNVVRLPRDWLGPREELIPFGHSADSAVDTTTASATTASTTARAPTADDFWGGSALPLDPLRAGPGTDVRGSLTPLFARARDASALVRRHPRSIAVFVVALTASIAITLPGAGGTSTTARRPAKTTAGLASSVSYDTYTRLLAQQSPAAVLASRLAMTHMVTGARSRLRSARHDVVRARRHGAARRAQPQGARATTPPVQSTTLASTAETSVTPASGSAAGGESSSVGSSASSGSQATSTPPTSASPPAATGAGSTHQTHSDGNQPALGANGALAPGSSPDG